jgi:transcriptional regulator with XRE-family HTH domain
MNHQDTPGRTLRHCRERLGMSQTRFAKFLGCSQSRVSKIEMGDLEPSATDLAKLVRRMTGINVWALIRVKLRGP